MAIKSKNKCICLLGIILAAALLGCQYSGNANVPGEAASEVNVAAKADIYSTENEKNIFEAPDMDDIELKNHVDAEDILLRQRIVFIMRSISFSEGYEHEGYFVDNEGYRHFFDLTRYSLSKSRETRNNNGSGEAGGSTDKTDNVEMYEYLLEHFDDFDKEEFLSVNDLKACVRLLYNVNETADVVTDGEPAIADYPSHTLYGVKTDGEDTHFVWLVDHGPNFEWLDDDCAKKIVELFGSDWMKRKKPVSDADSIKWKEEWQEKRDMKKAEISGNDGTLTVYVPDGWECVGFPQSEKDGSYSVRIKPDASLNGYISIAFEQQFGVCGTGLEEKEIQLAWDKAVAGYYDGSDKWSFIIYKGKNDNIVAINCAGDWFDDYEDEIMKILDYISFEPDYFLDYAYKSFKQDNGIGVSLVIADADAAGADLYFICNSENKGHEYFYGDYYSLYIYNKENEEFESVFKGDMVFDDLAYNIDYGKASEFSIKWEKACGRLAPGLYRLEKIVNDKNYDPKKDEIRDYKFSADFVIY